MKWYHKRSFMVPFKFILIVQNNSEIFKSIPYRYKFPVGARDLFSSRMRVLCEASFCASTKNGLNKSVHKFKTKFKIKTTSNQKMWLLYVHKFYDHLRV